jgi:Holliday junction DNA helicase RuvA
MIASVTGRLELRGSESRGVNYLILSVGGIGLKVLVPADHLDRWSRLGQEVTLHTYLHVRESELTLYGFPDVDERNLFEMLITVSGIGPKLGLSALSSLSANALRSAIAQGRAEMLSQIPGIGDKTARRLIFHLQDKVTLQLGPAAAPMLTDADAEVISALTALGYTVVEAQAAVQRLPRDDDMAIGDRLRLALSSMGTG